MSRYSISHTFVACIKSHIRRENGTIAPFPYSTILNKSMSLCIVDREKIIARVRMYIFLSNINIFGSVGGFVHVIRFGFIHNMTNTTLFRFYMHTWSLLSRFIKLNQNSFYFHLGFFWTSFFLNIFKYFRWIPRFEP